MNDKATEKHHWPSPGTTIGQGKWCPKGSLPAHHPTQKHSPVPCPRQESGLIASSECPAKALPGDPFSRLRKAKELPGELG